MSSTVKSLRSGPTARQSCEEVLIGGNFLSEIVQALGGKLDEHRSGWNTEIEGAFKLCDGQLRSLGNAVAHLSRDVAELVSRLSALSDSANHNLADQRAKLDVIAGQANNALGQLSQMEASLERSREQTDAWMQGATARIELTSDELKHLQDQVHSTARDSAETMARMEQSACAGFTHINQELEDQIGRNRSWLASPYPRKFRVAERSPSWGFIQHGAAWLGIRMQEPLRLKVLCERCEGQNKGDPPYQIDGVHLDFEEEAVKFYFHAGIAIGVIVIGEHLPPLQFLIHDQKLLDNLHRAVRELPDGAAELGRHLAPDLLARVAFDKFKKANKAPLSGEDFQDAATAMFRDLRTNTLSAISLGGNAHIHVGKLIELDDITHIMTRRPYGGLVRVLTDNRKEYTWICDECWSKNYRAPERPSI